MDASAQWHTLKLQFSKPGALLPVNANDIAIPDYLQVMVTE
jgi:hypothetical protein